MRLTQNLCDMASAETVKAEDLDAASSGTGSKKLGSSAQTASAERWKPGTRKPRSDSELDSSDYQSSRNRILSPYSSPLTETRDTAPQLQPPQSWAKDEAAAGGSYRPESDSTKTVSRFAKSDIQASADEPLKENSVIVAEQIRDVLSVSNIQRFLHSITPAQHHPKVH
nr:uncharacterized protein LOC109167964 isoform X2 [Ipomoea trifida]